MYKGRRVRRSGGEAYPPAARVPRERKGDRGISNRFGSEVFEASRKRTDMCEKRTYPTRVLFSRSACLILSSSVLDLCSCEAVRRSRSFVLRSE